MTNAELDELLFHAGAHFECVVIRPGAEPGQRAVELMPCPEEGAELVPYPIDDAFEVDSP